MLLLWYEWGMWRAATVERSHFTFFQQKAVLFAEHEASLLRSAPFLALVGFLDRLVGDTEVQTPTEAAGGRVAVFL